MHALLLNKRAADFISRYQISKVKKKIEEEEKSGNFFKGVHMLVFFKQLKKFKPSIHPNPMEIREK